MIDNFVNNSGKGQKSARDLTYDVQMGRVSPQAAQKMVDEATKNSHSFVGAEKAQAAGWGAALLGTADRITGRHDAAGSNAVLEKQARDGEIAQSKELADAIKQMTAALKAHPVMNDSKHPSRSDPMSADRRGGTQ